ncbi:MAG: hypothetical protein F6K30_13710 [Cyanothece sp. SIO2G6]|nr:hypothetical protein [Cyanothece sp. SIO2G6]
MHPILIQTIAALTDGSQPRPMAADLVTALLETEQGFRKTKASITYDQLVGTWQLRFITGTKRSRQQTGVVLGAGRFIPPWLVQIHLSYSQPDPISELGQVQNSVSLGPLSMTLTGPTRLWAKTNRLAFDFTHMAIQVGNKTLYQQTVRGGKEQAQAFATQTLKDQAFFSYFLVEPNSLAARGRGGGLALWTRLESD